jgi:hypothetical protein
MKKIIFILLCCCFVFAAQAQQHKLQFHQGKFKIVQFTDLHWVVDDAYQARNDSTLALVKTMIETEHPDLVVFTGDVIVSWNAIRGWKTLTDLLVKEKTYFVVSFGNHDEETDMNNAQILQYLRTVPYNLTFDAEKLSGSGNCNLSVYSSDGNKEKWMLYFFDSHNLVKDYSLGYYNWVHHDQIDWYRRTSDATTVRNGHRLPSMAFFHIPFPEFNTALYYNPAIGNKQESVCSPAINSGLCAAFLEQKDVVGVFVGHDHNNDYLVDYNGYLALAYGRKTGYPSAYKEVLNRGARIINLQEDEASFNTYVRDLKAVSFPYMFEQKNRGTDIPQFAGSFIQHELVAKWDETRWDKEMAMLKEAGMKYLIYAPSLSIDERGRTFATYPTKLAKQHDKSLEKCLISAQKYGLKIFIGLNFSERWWKVDYNADWLINQMETGNCVADELTSLYKKRFGDTMYGWYWVWEVDNVGCKTAERQAILARALNTNLDHLKQLCPDMPLLLSPYMNEKMGTSDEYGKMWQNVFAQTHFRNNDIFCPQDCIGAGGLILDHLEDWFNKLKAAVMTKPGLKFWANTETFDQRFWTSASLDRIIKQMNIVNRYVSNFICFAYSHYDSPFVVDSNYHKGYLQYCKDGQLPQMGLPNQVSNVSVEKEATGFLLKWKALDLMNVSGYSIYKNGELLMRVGIKGNKIPTQYLDKQPTNVLPKYEIAVYNAIGKESNRVMAIYSNQK